MPRVAYYPAGCAGNIGRPLQLHRLVRPSDRLDSLPALGDSGNMTDAARKLLETFDSLPKTARQEVLRELLRRAALSEHDFPQDSELSAAADEIFSNWTIARFGRDTSSTRRGLAC